MGNSIRRHRMVGGPNGSGKSTLINDLAKQVNLHSYFNADEIEVRLKENTYPISTFPFDFVEANSHLSNHYLHKYFKGFQFESNETWQGPVNSYLASALTEFLRVKCMRELNSLTFETVMSHQSKIDFLVDAKALGFRNYLYFITTQDPQINIDRVKQRVALGGHHVDEDKIVSRYWKSLQNLLPAILLSDRAYLFDNSGKRYELVAEVTRGTRLELKGNLLPNWLGTYLLN